MYYRNLQFLNNVIIIKAKVLHLQTLIKAKVLPLNIGNPRRRKTKQKYNTIYVELTVWKQTHIP
jgi:hypothetical protein